MNFTIRLLKGVVVDLVVVVRFRPIQSCFKVATVEGTLNALFKWESFEIHLESQILNLDE